MTTKSLKPCYRASGNGSSTIADTPRGAAINYFNRNPKTRKCYVIQGTYDGLFFTVNFGRVRPKFWKDVTKRTADTLPDTCSGE